MILIERLLPPFHSGLFFLLSSVSTRRRVSLRGTLCSYFTVSCSIENTLSRVIASHPEHLSSRTSSLYANLLDLVIINRITTPSHSSLFPRFAFLFIADCIRCIRRLSCLLQVFGYLLFFIITLFGFISFINVDSLIEEKW